MLRRLIDALFNRSARLRASAEANEAGILAWQSGNRPAAEAHFRAAFAHRPDYAAACSNLGMVLVEAGRLDEGHSLLLRAVELDPMHAGARINLANTLYIDGRLDESLTHFREARMIAPGSSEVVLNIVRPLMDACAWDDVEEFVRQTVRTHEEHPAHAWSGGLLPFVSQLLPLPGALRRRIADEQAAWLIREWGGLRPGLQAVMTGQDKRRFRIGYLSRDFRNNAVGHLTAAMFGLHDRSRFEVTAYSFGPDDGSEWRRRIETGCEHFRDLRDADPVSAARCIADDGIDVLVDFGGHTGGSRPEILALRPAPVQVNWLGYPGTFGAGLADYVIGDRVALPPALETEYAEAVVRMPECYQVNDCSQTIASRVPDRADAGLPGEGVVYCGFNQAFKIDRAVFSAWMRILGSVPGSVLWLLRSSDAAADSLRQAARLGGIDPARLVFAPPLPKAEHLARHALADLFLDTWSVNAGTTASDALWAGLPVLTCPGERFVTRVAASLVSAAGLPELVASGRDEYERIAIGLGHNPRRVEQAKERLAQSRLTSALFDTARFVQHLEDALETMVARHRGGNTPCGFDVPAR